MLFKLFFTTFYKNVTLRDSLPSTWLELNPGQLEWTMQCSSGVHPLWSEPTTGSDPDPKQYPLGWTFLSKLLPGCADHHQTKAAKNATKLILSNVKSILYLFDICGGWEILYRCFTLYCFTSKVNILSLALFISH